jgi:hypothetical protein
MPWQRGTPTGPRADPRPEPASPTLLAWANAVDATSLSMETAEAAEQFLRDYRRMPLAARREIAFRLRDKVNAQVRPAPPVSIGNMDAIATALAARRRQLGLGGSPP